MSSPLHNLIRRLPGRPRPSDPPGSTPSTDFPQDVTPHALQGCTRSGTNETHVTIMSSVPQRCPTIGLDGITIVYDPGDEAKLDIVLVHGLFGHPQNTWMADGQFSENPGTTGDMVMHGQGVFWPYDLLPKRLPQARVVTWGYDVQIEGRSAASSTASIPDHSERLLSDLDPIRCDKERPIIYMAHSLGGIIVKCALRSRSPLVDSIRKATAGIIFFGTPHQGSDVANLRLGRIARRIACAFVKTPNPRILEALEKPSDLLEIISRDFLAVLKENTILVHSFREELKTAGVLVVDSYSSKIGSDAETHGILHADHRHMVKFTSSSDPNFERVVAVLHRWLGITGANEPTTPLTADQAASNSAAVDDAPDNFMLRQAYRECLDSLNFREARNRVVEVKDPYEDTSHWLLRRETTFSSWLRGGQEKLVFWIQGKPGSGKSVLMKYASKSNDTLALLKEFHQGHWVVIRHFFHDRGTAIQKSTEGLLGEILFQILHQYPSVFILVFKMLEHNGILPLPNPLHHSPQKETTSIWSRSLMEQALKEIGKKAELNMNICIFVDALDEHNGDQKELMEALKILIGLGSNKFVKLRICLASRPENIFKEAFSFYPSLVVQEHNEADIRSFTSERLGRNAEGQSQILVDEVLRKAQGVFLWVKLVVEELEEGLREGDSQEDMMRVLETIPSELSELYTRALLRPRRKSPGTMAIARKETYCMLKIASAWDEPVWVDFLLSAAILLAYDVGTAPRPELMVANMPKSWLSNRLYSRSAGFLEAPSRARDTDGRAEFIHQTAKEYLRSEKAHETIKGWSPTPEHPETGMMMSLRYIIHLFTAYCERTLPNPTRFPIWSERIIRCLRVLEREENSCVGPMIEPVLMRFYRALPPTAPANFRNDLFCGFESTLKEIFTGRFLAYLPRSRAMMLTLSIVWGLPLSIRLYMPLYDDQALETSPSSSSLESRQLVISEAEAVRLVRLTQGTDDFNIPLRALKEAGIQAYISESSWETELSGDLEAPPRIYLWH